MAHSSAVRDAARAAYIYEGRGVEDVARQVGAHDATVRKWKAAARTAGDDWDRARAAAQLAGRGAEAIGQAVVEQFVRLFQNTIEDLQADKAISALDRAEALSRLADAYNKTLSAVAKTSPRLNKLAVAMEVLEKLADYIGTHQPDAAAALLAALEPFGQELVKAYG